MSPVREPSTPPNIEGYDFEAHLGSGGYADVFLYTRAMPKMQVAIKVLLHTSLSSTDLSRFTAEANAMAALASHPFIVPILGADVAPDGRPYIVMRYYPGGNLSTKVRREPLSVVEALRIGIEISSAVESAHRVGILHRDIKPANILISEFGQPGLTDFGISLNDKSALAEREEGLSIPWSPPEAFGDETKIARTGDVYSLAATVYTFLTGRSPFEVPGGSNKQIDLIQRIEKSPPPSTGRADVPESLERFLSQAMAKSASLRPQSAYEFAQGLQATELELRLKPTAIVVPEVQEQTFNAPKDIEDKTRLKSPIRVDAQKEPDKTDNSQPGFTPGLSTRSSDALKSEISKGQVSDLESTVLKPSQQTSVEIEAPSKKSGGKQKIIYAVLVVVLIIIGLIVYLGNSPSHGSTNATTSSSITTSPNAIYSVPPTPTNLTLVRQGTSVNITWTNPSPQPGDSYQWNVTNAVSNSQVATTTSTHATLNNVASTTNPCVSVILVRSDGHSSSPASSCLP